MYAHRLCNFHNFVKKLKAVVHHGHITNHGTNGRIYADVLYRRQGCNQQRIMDEIVAALRQITEENQEIPQGSIEEIMIKKHGYTWQEIRQAQSILFLAREKI